MSEHKPNNSSEENVSLNIKSGVDEREVARVAFWRRAVMQPGMAK